MLCKKIAVMLLSAYFLPGKNQFHDFFGILLPPKPIMDVAIMAAKL